MSVKQIGQSVIILWFELLLRLLFLALDSNDYCLTLTVAIQDNTVTHVAIPSQGRGRGGGGASSSSPSQGQGGVSANSIERIALDG